MRTAGLLPTIATVFFITALAFSQEESAPAFRKIKLVNADFSAPSSGGSIIGWLTLNRNLTPALKVERDDKGKYLSVAAGRCTCAKPDCKEVRGLVYNAEKFHAKPGTKIRISVDYRSPDHAKMGVILWNIGGRANQWICWKLPCTTEWKTLSREYIIKAAPKTDTDPEVLRSYYAGFDIWDGTVQLRNFKAALER